MLSCSLGASTTICNHQNKQNDEETGNTTLLIFSIHEFIQLSTTTAEVERLAFFFNGPESNKIFNILDVTFRLKAPSFYTLAYTGIVLRDKVDPLERRFHLIMKRYQNLDSSPAHLVTSSSVQNFAATDPV